VFSRKGDDLEYRVRIPLVSALTGTILSIPTLDQRTLHFPVRGCVCGWGCGWGWGWGGGWGCVCGWGWGIGRAVAMSSVAQRVVHQQRQARLPRYLSQPCIVLCCLLLSPTLTRA
jgi:hypothetical protein